MNSNKTQKTRKFHTPKTIDSPANPSSPVAAMGGGGRILVSACLIGKRVRYDGRRIQTILPAIARWRDQGVLIPICPEIAGGAPVPRPAAEIMAGDGIDVLEGRCRLMDTTGADVTASFVAGARRALALAREKSVTMAILKARSPSCGNNGIYDGTFSGQQRTGMGVTAALLVREGIQVFNETQIDEAVRFWNGGN